MRLAKPGPKLIPAARADGVLLDVRLEVLGANPTRIKAGEESHKALDIGLL